MLFWSPCAFCRTKNLTTYKQGNLCGFCPKLSFIYYILNCNANKKS